MIRLLKFLNYVNSVHASIQKLLTLNLKLFINIFITMKRQAKATTKVNKSETSTKNSKKQTKQDKTKKQTQTNEWSALSNKIGNV